MRIKVKFIVLLGMILSGLVATTAHAQLWSWATESAIAKFSPEDIDLLKSTVRDALNNQPDDTELSWANADTGHSGSVKVFGTKEIEGQTCRQVVLKNNAKTVQGSAEYFVCEQEDGKWSVSASQ